MCSWGRPRDPQLQCPEGQTVNVIVIVSDTVRVDHLGCYGNEWMHTESIDALAAESVIFSNCYTASFPTIPHRCDCFLDRTCLGDGGSFPFRSDCFGHPLFDFGFDRFCILVTRAFGP